MTSPATAIRDLLIEALARDPQITGAIGTIHKDNQPADTDRPYMIVTTDLSNREAENEKLFRHDVTVRCEAYLSGPDSAATVRVIGRVLGAAAGFLRTAIPGGSFGGFVTADYDVSPDETPNGWIGSVEMTATAHTGLRS